MCGVSEERAGLAVARREKLSALVTRRSARSLFVARLGRRPSLGSVVARRSAQSSLVARLRLGLRSSFGLNFLSAPALPRLAPPVASLLAPRSPSSWLLENCPQLGVPKELLFQSCVSLLAHTCL